MSEHKNKIRECLLSGLLLASFSAGAAPNLDEARRLLDAGQAEQAAALLESEMLALAGEAEFDFLFGQALYRAGQPGQALFAFERVLMAEPEHLDARLLAARICAERAELDYARELLLPMQDKPLDQAHQRELDNVRRAIAAAASAPMTLRGYVTAGLGGDSNVTSGPERRLLMIPGLGSTPTNIGTAARDGDTVGTLESGLSLQKAMGENWWLTADGSLMQGFNRQRKDTTEGYENLNLGLLTRSGSEFFNFALLAQDYRISHASYRYTMGGKAAWIHAFADNSLLTAYMQQLVFTFPVATVDDATRVTAGLLRDSVLGENAALQYGVSGGKETAKDATKPHFSFEFYGASAGIGLPLNANWSLSAAAVYERRDYLATDPLHQLTRQDNVGSFGLALDYRVADNWHLTQRLTHLRNASNAALYDFTRSTYSMQLRWEFDNEND